MNRLAFIAILVLSGCASIKQDRIEQMLDMAYNNFYVGCLEGRSDTAPARLACHGAALGYKQRLKEDLGL